MGHSRGAPRPKWLEHADHFAGLFITTAWWRIVGARPSTDADPPHPTASGPGVLTRSYTANRAGANLLDTILTTQNVNSTDFGKNFCRPVDDEIYAQPLYVPGLDVAGKGKHNTVVTVTMNDSVYAYDADVSGPSLWEKHFADPARGITPLPTTHLTGSLCS